ncbi:LysM domain protein [compost metagenome]
MPQVEEEVSPTPRTDALEWKRLFSRSQEEERRVRQLKVCIVQKEETLEDIATRYGLNPKEIQLYNRLQDAESAEGKTLLIPV